MTYAATLCPAPAPPSNTAAASMPYPPPKGLTSEEIEAVERFALATGIAPPALFAPPRPRPPHVGACRCPDCRAPEKPAARPTPRRQPWEPKQ
jgi:hypothetical protein